ncbi:MAG: hypothetical protein M0R06_06245 [Sphaerochaeta sp.]|nr:hypothetical protein [Sphaerochaeta sp.]
MENEKKKDIVITQEEIQTIVLKAIPEHFAKVVNDSYSSPIRKIIEQEVENRLEDVRMLVSQIVTKAFKDDDFKTKLGEAVLSALVNKGLSGR